MTIPFLSNLGVPPLAQGRQPTPEIFPSAFNASNKSLWSEIVSDVVPQADPRYTWASCIKTYIETCEAQNLFPFQTFKQTVNDQISDFLREARRLIVRYINLSGLFDELKITHCTRKVTVNSNGFTVIVFAKVFITDPLFEQWLTQIPYPHFNVARQADGKWIKVISPGVKMFVLNDKVGGHLPQRWHVGYEIDCSMFPEIPTNSTPSKVDLEKFILEILWMPLLRANRPHKILRRLI